MWLTSARVWGTTPLHRAPPRWSAPILAVTGLGTHGFALRGLGPASGLAFMLRWRLFMRRLSSTLALLLVALAGCAPVFDVDASWTINGDEPVNVCESLPEGAEVRFIIRSRDRADGRFDSSLVETEQTAQCADGSATIQTGAFAEVLTEVRDGDVILGVAPGVEVSPGYGNAEGTAFNTDIALLQGTLKATMTVLGQACGDAGAASFTVTLLENVEPRTNVAVDGAIDVTVPCTDNAAVFSFTPVKVGARYSVEATTSIGGDTFSTGTAGEGVVADGAATALTVDLQKAP